MKNLCLTTFLNSLYVTILRKLEHSHIVKLVEVLANKSQIYIVMELVTGGDLFDKIKTFNTK